MRKLVHLVKKSPKPGKHFLLAFDAHRNEEGEMKKEETEFYTPNEYILEITGKNPDIFLPTCSIHPYRSDSLEELEKANKRGIKLIKWLPNAMNIDPSNPRCDPFYAKLKQYGMVIVCHWYSISHP